MRPAGVERRSPDPAQASRIEPWLKGLLLVLLLVSSMVGLSGRLLSSHDEARYAEVAREMLESGDWLTPRLSGIEHWHKPPLTYWAIAASFAAFGLTEFAARLPSALAAVASVIALCGIGRMLFGRRAGVLGGIVLASSLLFVVMGRLATPDMLLACWTCWAVYFLVRATVHSDRTGACALFHGLFIGLGFITKGPLIFVFVVVPALVFVVLTGRWKELRAAKPWLSAATLCAVGLPWFVVVCVQNPGLLRFFVEFQTLQRVASDLHERAGPALYYVPVFLYGFAPWVFFLPYAIMRATSFTIRSLDEAKARGLFLLLLWLVPFVFLSLSRSKGLAYMLPALAPAALLVGRLFDQAMAARAEWAKGFAANVWVALAGMALFAGWVLFAFFAHRAYPELAALRGYVVLFSALIGVGAVVAVLGLRGRVQWLLVGGLAAPVPIAVLVLLATMPDVSGTVSWEAAGKYLADEIAVRMGERDHLVFYRSISHSTSFYMRARPILVSCDVDVRFMGPEEYEEWLLDGEPPAVLNDLFDRAAAEDRRLFCTALKKDYTDLVERPGAPRTYFLAERHRTVLFSNRPDKRAGSSVGDTPAPAGQSPEQSSE